MVELFVTETMVLVSKVLAIYVALFFVVVLYLFCISTCDVQPRNRGTHKGE